LWRGSLANGYACDNLCADGAGINFQPASNFANAFGHAGQANAAAGTVFPQALHYGCGHAIAIVSYAQDHLVASRL
jgi:hypothetical protein